ncbi:tRNA delta(2)-isopentenylpyrophosphate transferase [Paenibacillus swuensis]|uniref:tRNA dimethylallyltransferase n=1 Tax=Paenibacillus swuensis TaxID=1178515 RepID=A0A172TLE9_9BACL|nr:tRNA (adenosine(37)-N6)-dimethylallyltransferase MiaA [Paenibacillus swuensis]ANE47885.1 tRNA delta(2)-isopentenylpyrophosphate transferase [Paenibacillus swuensis]
MKERTSTDSPAKPKLLVLLGPTAIGKTRLSIELAKRFGCEIISGDSMQVYRGMDIGTAKIRPEEMEGVPHHMIDIHEPDYPFSVAEFQDESRRLIQEISDRDKLPFIVGGTGLYIESLCYSFEFSESGSDEAFREEKYRYAEIHGAEALHLQLQASDPVTAERLHPNDLRRVVRALEIVHLTGMKLSDQLLGQKKETPYELCIVGLTMERDLLYKRIEERIDEMLALGLVEEVQRVIEAGCPRDAISIKALGYKEMLGYLDGEYTMERAEYLLKRNTRRFAKRQLSWFRHMKDIQWIDVTETSNFYEHLTQVSDIIARTLKIDDNQHSI